MSSSSSTPLGTTTVFIVPFASVRVKVVSSVLNFGTTEACTWSQRYRSEIYAPPTYRGEHPHCLVEYTVTMSAHSPVDLEANWRRRVGQWWHIIISLSKTSWAGCIAACDSGVHTGILPSGSTRLMCWYISSCLSGCKANSANAKESVWAIVCELLARDKVWKGCSTSCPATKNMKILPVGQCRHVLLQSPKL